ncbi:PepSY-associated TM helix domain-containing protein [Cellvibrio sp. OA-2007]|uniref:PepSY-associated TM helix domain-containing protein n=1 Tax=Cellvibrio sp. OA-2007 TaxID=529823 RepID=UPI000780CF4F|nr:PepSY-associated TM helix domain-containing protein [Cellvibrio sp. OA-2007]
MTWLGSVRQWHWMSSALCLVGMLLFAITGITLNHAAQIPSKPVVKTQDAFLSKPLLKDLQQQIAKDNFPTHAPLPDALINWLDDNHSIALVNGMAEWSEDDIYLSQPRAGGDAWVSIDLTSGEVIYEQTDRGWIAYFNDLHKGRNTGGVWSWFIDVFAVACIIFCITGLLLLQRYASTRFATWPLVGLGLVLPWLLILLFMH